MGTKRSEYNDPEKVAEAKKREEEERLQLLRDIREILELRSKGGIRFFRWLFSHSYLFTPLMTGNSQTFHREGKRELALFVLEHIVDSGPQFLADILIQLPELKEEE